jgi:TetR/AcrR family transcriptional regulator, transcriptional repressor for nem operon
LASNAKFRTASLAYMNAWAAKIEEALRIAQEAKEIPKQKDPAVLSRFLLAAFFGAALRIRLLKSLVPFEEFIEIAFGDLLINSKQTAAKAK